jgi:phosphoserine aminotransferase
MVPDWDWIPADRQGLSLCDATSAVFAMEIDWPKIDVLTFSWQKCLGGEAAHGVLILSPRAAERARNHVPSWPVPKLFRLARLGYLDEALFEGQTINTPSMLCVEDCAQAVRWAAGAGGAAGLRARASRNASLVREWIARSDWATDPVVDPRTGSLTSVVIGFADPRIDRLEEPAQRRFVAQLCSLLEAEGAAFDISGHRGGPPCLRVWTGPTVEADDIEAVLPWLDWAYYSTCVAAGLDP